MLDFSQFTHLSFDCYGTLIDWESGILDAVGSVLRRHGIRALPQKILRLFSRYEAHHETGIYRSYRDVLRRVMASLASELGFEPSADDLEVLPRSVRHWQPFPDTFEALTRLKQRYWLVILSNIDEALFSETAKLLAVPFDKVITAQQVQSYKPSPGHFRFALEKLGVAPLQVLHVAQSLYHDHVPAKQLGFSTVWVNRPSRLPGTGLALPVSVRPDIAVPDLRSLVECIQSQVPV
jgi:2-haloacid dehalogenase